MTFATSTRTRRGRRLRPARVPRAPTTWPTATCRDLRDPRPRPSRARLRLRCGTLDAVPAAHGFDAVGVDISADMIRQARRDRSQRATIAYRRRRLRRVRGGVLDLVLSVFTFDNVPTMPRKVALFSRLARLLAADGRMVNLVRRPTSTRTSGCRFSTKDFPGTSARSPATPCTRSSRPSATRVRSTTSSGRTSRTGTCSRGPAWRCSRRAGRSGARTSRSLGQRGARGALGHLRPRTRLRRPPGGQLPEPPDGAAAASNVWRAEADGAGLLVRDHDPRLPDTRRQPQLALDRLRDTARREGEVGAIVDQLALRERSGLDQQLQPSLAALRRTGSSSSCRRVGTGPSPESLAPAPPPPGTARRCGPTWPAGRRRPPSRPSPGAPGRPSSSGCAPAPGAPPGARARRPCARPAAPPPAGSRMR